MKDEPKSLSQREIDLAIYLYQTKKYTKTQDMILKLYEEEDLKLVAFYCGVTYNRVYQVYTENKDHINKVRYGC